MVVSQSSTTGAVSIVCTPIYQIGVVSSGQTFTTLEAIDGTDLSDSANNSCSDATSCYAYANPGDHGEVVIQSGSVTTGAGAEFSYTCPGGSSTEAVSRTASISGVYYQGVCDFTALAGNYVASAG